MQNGFVTGFHKAKQAMSWKIALINTEGQIWSNRRQGNAVTKLEEIPTLGDETQHRIRLLEMGWNSLLHSAFLRLQGFFLGKLCFIFIICAKVHWNSWLLLSDSLQTKWFQYGERVTNTGLLQDTKCGTFPLQNPLFCPEVVARWSNIPEIYIYTIYS